ncbi:MAG: efflux RND transporter permease subunit [Bacteroidales bacterium]|nr:efflux RND transporter permease subunit [Bacteroidales bacterium]
MKKITQFSVNNPVTVSMIVIAILLLGYISFEKLSVDLFPDLNAPRIFVEIKSGERSPEELEKRFVKNIESQAIRLKGVKEVSSICMVGSARVTVEYNWGSDMDEAFLNLQKALVANNQNPDIDNFTITQHDPNISPVMIIGMTNPEVADMNELRQIGESYIRNELIRLEGIADVKLSGVEEKEILIETEQYKLDAHNLTTNDIVGKIQMINKNVSGGSIVEMDKKYIIKGTSLVESIQDIESIVIAYKNTGGKKAETDAKEKVENKAPVFLKDVANVRFKNKKPQNIVRINGTRCVGLSIYKETGFNTVKAVENLKESFKTIKKALPNYEFKVIQNQGKFIQTAINEVKETSLLGILIAVFVLFIFLRRLKVTAIISFAIPISVIATFNLMYFNGLSLNIMTLGGLALGAGMLVDNAIVVMENIFRNMEQGMSVRDAAVKGTAEVSGAIVASTLTTIVVFLPIVYLQGASGALFKDQAWTVAFSLLASLFVAILVIPMLFNYAYRNHKKEKELQSVRIKWYGNILAKILNRKALVLSLSLLILGLTIYILPKVGSEYLPQSGAGEFSIEIKLDEGTRLERTTGTVENIEQMLTELLGDRVDIIYSQIGASVASNTDKSVFQNENTATLKICLKDSVLNQSESIITSVEALMEKIPNAEISIVRNETALQSTVGTNEAPLVVEVKGKDLDVLGQISEQIKIKLQEVPELLNVKTNIEEGAPEIDVVIDSYKAGIYNIGVSDITSQLKNLLVGKNAGKYEKNGEMSDITIRLPNISLSQFNSLTIKNGTTKIPLYELARIEKSNSPKQLFRRNQNRIAKVMANMTNTISFDKAILKVKNKLSDIDLPQDYYINVVGQEQKRKDAMSGLRFALILSIILVYMVMASQFESLIHPFTILLTIPLAGIGAIWAFFILGKSLSIMAYIGIIMLAGIAVNDSIILVDAINKFKAQGFSLRESIIFAGENRIRPIIMTSLTTILALLPLTFGFGESAALRSPMAIAVIAGLVTSTLLTLVVIPCVYYVFDIIISKLKTNR